MRHEGKEFNDTAVSLDYNEYIGCEMNRCQIVWTGATGITLKGCSFEKCQVIFSGPAGTAIKALRSLYHGGFKELVEQTIDTIRTPPPEDEEVV